MTYSKIEVSVQLAGLNLDNDVQAWMIRLFASSLSNEVFPINSQKVYLELRATDKKQLQQKGLTQIWHLIYSKPKTAILSFQSLNKYQKNLLGQIIAFRIICGEPIEECLKGIKLDDGKLFSGTFGSFFLYLTHSNIEEDWPEQLKDPAIVDGALKFLQKEISISQEVIDRCLKYFSVLQTYGLIKETDRDKYLRLFGIFDTTLGEESQLLTLKLNLNTRLRERRELLKKKLEFWQENFLGDSQIVEHRPAGPKPSSEILQPVTQVVSTVRSLASSYTARMRPRISFMLRSREDISRLIPLEFLWRNASLSASWLRSSMESLRSLYQKPQRSGYFCTPDDRVFDSPILRTISKQLKPIDASAPASGLSASRSIKLYESPRPVFIPTTQLEIPLATKIKDHFVDYQFGYVSCLSFALTMALVSIPQIAFVSEYIGKLPLGHMNILDHFGGSGLLINIALAFTVMIFTQIIDLSVVLSIDHQKQSVEM